MLSLSFYHSMQKWNSNAVLRYTHMHLQVVACLLSGVWTADISPVNNTPTSPLLVTATLAVADAIPQHPALPLPATPTLVTNARQWVLFFQVVLFLFLNTAVFLYTAVFFYMFLKCVRRYLPWMCGIFFFSFSFSCFFFPFIWPFLSFFFFSFIYVLECLLLA